MSGRVRQDGGFATLRELLYRPPSPAGFAELLEVLGAERLADREVAVSYVRSHLDSWPDDARIAPHHWADAAPRDVALPSLVRAARDRAIMACQGATLTDVTIGPAGWLEALELDQCRQIRRLALCDPQLDLRTAFSLLDPELRLEELVLAPVTFDEDEVIVLLARAPQLSSLRHLTVHNGIDDAQIALLAEASPWWKRLRSLSVHGGLHQLPPVGDELELLDLSRNWFVGSDSAFADLRGSRLRQLHLARTGLGQRWAIRASQTLTQIPTLELLNVEANPGLTLGAVTGADRGDLMIWPDDGHEEWVVPDSPERQRLGRHVEQLNHGALSHRDLTQVIRRLEVAVREHDPNDLSALWLILRAALVRTHLGLCQAESLGPQGPSMVLPLLRRMREAIVASWQMDRNPCDDVAMGTLTASIEALPARLLPELTGSGLGAWRAALLLLHVSPKAQAVAFIGAVTSPSPLVRLVGAAVLTIRYRRGPPPSIFADEELLRWADELLNEAPRDLPVMEPRSDDHERIVASGSAAACTRALTLLGIGQIVAAAGMSPIELRSALDADRALAGVPTVGQRLAAFSAQLQWWYDEPRLEALQPHVREGGSWELITPWGDRGGIAPLEPELSLLTAMLG